MPESPTESRGALSRTVNASELAPVRREATSMSSSTLPMDAVGSTMWSSTEKSTLPVARSVALADTCTPS